MARMTRPACMITQTRPGAFVWGWKGLANPPTPKSAVVMCVMHAKLVMTKRWVRFGASVSTGIAPSNRPGSESMPCHYAPRTSATYSVHGGTPWHTDCRSHRPRGILHALMTALMVLPIPMPSIRSPSSNTRNL